MEYCPFGDLDQKIRRFYQRRKLIDEREIWVYAINILEGLVALHQKGVVHRGTPFFLRSSQPYRQAYRETDRPLPCVARLRS